MKRTDLLPDTDLCRPDEKAGPSEKDVALGLDHFLDLFRIFLSLDRFGLRSSCRSAVLKRHNGHLRYTNAYAGLQGFGIDLS